MLSLTAFLIQYPLPFFPVIHRNPVLISHSLLFIELLTISNPVGFVPDPEPCQVQGSSEPRRVHCKEGSKKNPSLRLEDWDFTRMHPSQSCPRRLLSEEYPGRFSDSPDLNLPSHPELVVGQWLSC